MRNFRTLICISLWVMSLGSLAQNESPLKPCPKSPNCVCTLEKKMRKKMPPLTFKNNLEESKTRIKEIVFKIEGTKLVQEDNNYLHFEFSTAIGKYIDDVEFYFDSTTQLIHFRSASRIGYGDFGANKRRMKRISKAWKA